jgi:hypothetical protein
LVFPRLETHYFDAWGPAQDWNSMAARLPDYDRVWIWEYSDDRAAFREAGSVTLGAPRAPERVVAAFDGRVWLLAARVELRGQVAKVELTWHSTAAAGEDVFAHVTDCAGTLLGQRDGATLAGAYPLWLWPPGVTVRDVRHVALATPPDNACYRVEVGLFNPADGTRTPAYGADGARLAADSLTLQP